MTSAKGIAAAWALIFCLVVLLSDVRAGDGHVGHLRIHPYLSASAGYTDNVFLTKGNERSDTFYLLSPGIQVILPVERHALTFDYTVDNYTYRERDEADRTVHNATGTLDLTPRQGFNVQIRDTFTRSEDPPDFEGDRTSPYIWNSPSIDTSFEISRRLALGAGYRYETKQYDRSVDRIDDYEGNGLSGQLYYRILPKISLVTFYGYQTRDYDRRRSDDSDSHRVEGGISWRISAKSRGTARVGYMQADYPTLDRTDDTISYAIDLTHQLRPKTSLFLEGTREVLDTSRADDNLAYSNSYVSTQLSATLTHRYRKLTGRLKAGLIRDEYLHDDIASGKKRRDDLFMGEFGVDHALRKWLTLGGSYRYSRLNSNFDIEEYTENIFLLYVSLVL